jgi:hypothetical protein
MPSRERIGAAQVLLHAGRSVRCLVAGPGREHAGYPWGRLHAGLPTAPDTGAGGRAPRWACPYWVTNPWRLRRPPNIRRSLRQPRRNRGRWPAGKARRYRHGAGDAMTVRSLTRCITTPTTASGLFGSDHGRVTLHVNSRHPIHLADLRRTSAATAPNVQARLNAFRHWHRARGSHRPGSRADSWRAFLAGPRRQFVESLAGRRKQRCRA